MNQLSRRTSRWLWLAAVTVAGAIAVQAADAPTLETKDKIAARVGVFRTGSTFTLDGGGRTGQTGDFAVDFGMGTGPVYVQDATFVNTLAQNDEMTVALWAKKYDTADGSAFWFNSPSSTGATRGFQAHLPWSNNSVYFDTAGCCDPPQRINYDIAYFAGYSGDVSWWNSWHFYVFVKKGVDKQIWIDGQLFLDQQTAQPGIDAAPLPTDFTDLHIGSDGTGTGGLFHAVVDDFAVFGTALSEATIGQLYSGTLPTALPASDKLTAYWDFNDSPGEGTFVSIKPAADATDAAPDLIEIVHIDGVTPWEASMVSLRVDGAAVTPTFVKDGPKATVSYVPSPIFGGQTTHRASFTYPGVGGIPTTIDWVFIVGAYTRDVVASYVGNFLGGSAYTADAGGRTGQAGDRAADFGNGTGPVHVANATFLNALTANDVLSFAFWMKKPAGIEAGSAFWANSPSVSADQRGFQAHVPWSDSNIYFDTAGCCDAGAQRISSSITLFPTYTDVTWWADWHHFVFQKNGAYKEIYIDGQLFHFGDNTAPLPTDFTQLHIGGTAPGLNLIRGVIDDFAIFGTALTDTTIGQLFGGTLPTALPPTDQLTAYWNFNSFPAAGILTSILPTPNSTNAAPDYVGVIHQDGSIVWDQANVSLKVDNNTVATTFTRNGTQVTVGYVPSPWFAAGSTHNAVLTYPGEGGTTQTLEWQFTVGTFPVLNEDLWTAPGTGDSTKTGLKARVWQVDQWGTTTLGLRTHQAEQELAGIIGPNVADLTSAVNGVFNIDLVNWNQNYETADIGNFQKPSLPDTAIPGIPGAGTQPNDSIAAEVITYIEFPAAGFYSMGVNSDDGFKVTVTDTPPANNLALVVTGAPSAAGSYHALSAPAATSKPFTAPVSAKLVYMDPADGCAAPVNAAELRGNIALVDRGTCEFGVKIKAAKDAGAIACVVVNNRDASSAEGVFPIEMGAGVAGYQDIPAVMISMPDGDTIKTGLGSELTASLSPDLTPALGEFDGGRGSSDTIFSFMVPTAGVYPFRCVWFEGGGDANLEWFSVTRSGEKILINDRTKTAALPGFRARTADPQPRPTIGATTQGGNLVITFTGTLQSADELTGQWTDESSPSPYTVATGGTKKFFRAKR